MFWARTSIVRSSCASTEEWTWTRHRADPNRRCATWPRPCCAWRRTTAVLHPLADRDARARRGRRGASPGRPGPDCPSGPHRRRSDRPTGPLAGSRRSGHNHGTITTTPGRSDPRGALHWTSRDSHRGRRHNRPGQSERRCALRSDRPRCVGPTRARRVAGLWTGRSSTFGTGKRGRARMEPCREPNGNASRNVP
jgi:hypothetical protein